MSTIKSTTGIQYADMTLKVAADKLEAASGKSVFSFFSDPAVTPLAPPMTNHVAVCTDPAIKVSASFHNEDQHLVQITQAIVMRADSICTAAFKCGSYTRPTAQLETVLKSLAQCLTANQTHFTHHD